MFGEPITTAINWESPGVTTALAGVAGEASKNSSVVDTHKIWQGTRKAMRQKSAQAQNWNEEVLPAATAEFEKMAVNFSSTVGVKLMYALMRWDEDLW